MATKKGSNMKGTSTVRVHFISGEERIVPAKDFHWHEEGARSATAIVDGREVPIYRRSEPEWGNGWVEQAALHHGVCVECDRLGMLNGAGVCEGCVMQAVIQENEA